MPAFGLAAVLVAACAPAPSPSAPSTGPTSTPAASVAAPVTLLPSAHPFVEAWTNVTAEAIGQTADWSNKVELADINADGAVDLLFANGGDYDVPGTPVASTVFLNDGSGTFSDATAQVMGDFVGHTRVIKAADLDADGHLDLLLGTTFDTQSQLLLGSADGSFTNVTARNLPAADLSVGDIEVGDVDADGDLDVVLTDWGDGNPFESAGRMQLWLNDGSGSFRDATARRMPETAVAFSWEIELLDVENDWDLDLAISCKSCRGSFLFENDGTGTFADVTDGRMPAFANNYEFTPIDLDADGFLDLVTINDGEDSGVGYREHVFRNDGTGSFEDVTAAWWPNEANRGYDDNMAVAMDVESDGDADFFIGSLDGPDRLLLNDGGGGLSAVLPIVPRPYSEGTLGWAVADLNGDRRPDLVESQGEVPGHEAEQVYLASDAIPPDSAPPIVVMEPMTRGLPDGHVTIRARVHDNRTPNMPHDWITVEVRWDGGDPVPLTWYGENLFRARVDLPSGATGLRVCAVDAAGNEACSF